MNSMPNSELAKHLGMNAHRVSCYMNYLGLKRTVILYSPRKECAKNPNYTKEEDQFLIDNFMHLSAEFISRKIGRTVNSVYRRAGRLGLKKNFRWL